MFCWVRSDLYLHLYCLFARLLFALPKQGTLWRSEIYVRVWRGSAKGTGSLGATNAPLESLISHTRRNPPSQLWKEYKGIPLQPVGKGLGVCSKGVLGLRLMTLEVPKVPERSLTIRRDHVAFGTVAKRSRNMKNEITESYETMDFVRVYGRDFRRLQCMFPTIYFQIDCFSHRLRWFVALVVSHVFVTHVLASRMSFTGSKSPNSGMSEQRSPPPPNHSIFSP